MMDERRFRRFLRVATAVFVAYFAGYGALRATHVLVRTGQFHGSANSRVFTTDGRWRDCDVGCPPGSSRHRWAEVAFHPLILAERTFWNTAGCHLKPPYGP